MRQVRKLRHWKQRFDPNAKFIWRRPVNWAGEKVKPGTVIPEALAENRVKLRRFWEARTIELAEFEAPDVLTGQAAAAPYKASAVTLIGHDDWPSEINVDGQDPLALGAVVEWAFDNSGLSFEEWNASDDAFRADRLQVALGELVSAAPFEEQGATEEFKASKPEDLVSKETDRKWNVKGLNEPFKTKTLALEAARALVSTSKTAESAGEDDDWLGG